jgi:hypothetical protein
LKIDLEKWYLDRIDSDGRVHIFYAAVLRIGMLPALRWTALFMSLSEENTMERQGYFRVSMPGFEGINWIWKTLGIHMEWTPRQVCPQGLILWQDAGTKIEWHCLSPLAQVESGDGTSGDGYVERIRIRLPGPRLPFRKLWWGRAHVHGESLVWIRWSVGLEKTWMLRNGTLVEGILETGEDGCIEARIAGERWRLRQSRVLRKRAIRTALPHWLVALCGSLPVADEWKFLGTMTLTRSDGEWQGSSIGEIVTWY